MKLNIYLISHPIIQIFNNQITQNQNKTHTNTNINNHIYYSKIMIFLIYELFRKAMMIQNVYIYQLDAIKHVTQVNSMQKNYVFTNIIENFDMINEISTTFPQTEIQHNDINKQNTYSDIEKCNFNNITNIIIIEKFLDTYNVIELLEFLTEQMKIKEKQIILACIQCDNQIIERISQKYNNIQLYTAQIINTVHR